MEGEEHPELGNLHQTPSRGHSSPITDPDRVLVPLLTQASSLPSTPVPSLEWDRSCLQEPFHGGQSNFLGIQRLEKRKLSATDPNFVDNLSIVRLVESAGNISSTVMSAMDAAAEDLMEEVDSMMDRMRIHPVFDIQEEFLEDNLLRLEGMKNDAEACLSCS